MGSYLATVARLAVLAVLMLIALGFVRVLIELAIEKRRKRRLTATRDISTLSPSDFEQYVAALFEKAGYRVVRTGGSGDGGVDLLVKRRGTTSVVQCKRYEDTIGPSTIRELIGAMTNAGIKDGLLITTSDFTAGAEREARRAPYKIDLVDGERLVHWARTYGLPGEVMDRGEARNRSQARIR
jgi:restriction endonuclease Mrr